ncbi:MAG: glucose 1-dehydrogenase [Chloroflexota bacterium]
MGTRLKDRVAVVTGAGRGIGRAVTLALAREGAAVVVNDIDPVPALEVVKEIEAVGARGLALVADIKQRAEAERLMKAAIDSFGRLDILVNNAGITRDLSLFKMQEKDWDDVLNICLKAAFFCTQAAASHMAAQAKQEKDGGREVSARKIINVTSGSGIRGNPGQANYSSAKAGLIGLTKAMAKELARYNILVNAIAPVAWTRITQQMSEELQKAFLTRIPLGRFGDPEKDIAPVVLFLASDDANYITGQVVVVSGGQDM